MTDEERRERKNARQREYAKRTGYAANTKSNQKNTKMIGIRFSVSTEGDMLRHIERQESISGYIKGLIRKDMESSEM